MSVFWITLKGMFFTALTAAISENLVFVRAFGMGELDYEEFTPRRALEEGYIVSLMSVLAAASGWLGRAAQASCILSQNSLCRSMSAGEMRVVFPSKGTHPFRGNVKIYPGVPPGGIPDKIISSFPGKFKRGSAGSEKIPPLFSFRFRRVPFVHKIPFLFSSNVLYYSKNVRIYQRNPKEDLP